MTTEQMCLEPCPFCGNKEPNFERMGTPRQSCIIECGNCGCRHESSDEGSNSGRQWNERAVQPADALQKISEFGEEQAAQPVVAPGLLPTDWLREDDLLYRTDEHGNNHDEIKVAMAGGRRDLDNRAEAARLLLAMLAAAPTPPLPQVADLIKRIAACTHGDPGRKSPARRGRWMTVMMRPDLWQEIERAAGIGPEQEGV